jgi:hypothetical protein
MDNSQIAMLDTESPKVKALVQLGETKFFELPSDDASVPKVPKMEDQAIAQFPIEYLEEFFKIMRKLKGVKPAHVRFYVKTDAPLKVEFKDGDGLITSFWLASRVEN